MNKKFDLLNKLRGMKRELNYSLYDQFNSFLSLFRPETIVNEREVRLIGLKRTGNHGITNWIIKQHGEVNIAYLNSVKPQYNPYRFYYNHFPHNRFSKDAFGEFTKKYLLLYSYEDKPLELISDEKFEKKHDLYLGKSANRYDVLIVRDPFNLFASRLKMMDDQSVKQNLIGTFSVNLWISYAQEFLGGSSFDKKDFTGKASQMKVLERWQHFRDDPRFISIFKNEKLWHYSEKIFGQIPGTDCLLNKV